MNPAMCKCNHTEDLHARPLPSLSPYSAIETDTGACKVAGCDCVKFREAVEAE